MPLAEAIREHPSASRRWRQRTAALARQILAPPPRLDVDTWANRFRYLGDGTPWRTERVPWIREMLQAASDPRVRRIVVRKAARLGVTEGLIMNAIGHRIHLRPCQIISALPTREDAETFSKTKLDPMIEASPELKRRVATSRSKSAASRILFKRFDAGHWSGVGTNSARMLRMREGRLMTADEVDAMPMSAGREGSVIDLLEMRGATFADSLLIEISSPSIVNASTIDAHYEISDQGVWSVPCPHCGDLQPLQWDQLRWDKRTLPDGREEPDLASVRYVCLHCAAEIEEAYKPKMAAAGTFVHRYPDRPIRGFDVNALTSTFPGAAWPNIVAKWYQCLADESGESTKVFVNTILGRSYEVGGERPDTTALDARRERYAAEVPSGVGILTAMVDVHGDRLELLVRGWGAHRESWLITHHRLWGDPADPQLWAQLDRELLRPYQHEDGATLSIACTLIDAGDGNTLDYVLAFVRPRQRRNVFAARGVLEMPKKGRKGGDRAKTWRQLKATKGGVKLVFVNTYLTKRTLFGELRILPPSGGEPAKPGYIHFPLPSEGGGFDREFLDQLGREHAVPRRGDDGQLRYYFKKTGRNEAIDLIAGSDAALHFLGEPVWRNVGVEVERVRQRGRAQRGQGTPVVAAGPAQRSRRQLNRGIQT
jgi:phage terminase large subunit GpA-like protein